MRRARLALAALALGACAADDPQTDPIDSADGPVIVTQVAPDTGAPSASSTSTSDPAPGTSAGHAPEPTSPRPTTTVPGAAQQVPDPHVEPRIALSSVGDFDAPLDLAVRPGDTAYYVAEKGGRVLRRSFDPGEYAVLLDISAEVSGGSEQGLLGLAFHPTLPQAYVDYTDTDGNTVIAAYDVAADGTFDPATRRVILMIDQPYGNHNGGGLLFGPDGMLYIGTGDGGSAGDPERRASDPFDLLGKLLRIDPEDDPGGTYAIPSDNPFADGTAGAPEVWALGLRNPWRFDVDTVAGDLWIADVGQNDIEEVNRIALADSPGANFGWSAYEGTARYNDDVPDDGTLIAPVLTYTHEDGCSVSGGVVYRGAAIPSLQGWYVYSDFCSGTLWALDLANGRNVVLADALSAVGAVRTGPDGEAYVVSLDGELLQIIPA